MAEGMSSLSLSLQGKIFINIELGLKAVTLIERFSQVVV